MFRWPCKDYLKRTCTNSLCEKWLSTLQRLQQEAGEEPQVPTYSYKHQQWEERSSSSTWWNWQGSWSPCTMKTCRCTKDFSNRAWDVPQVCTRAPALSSSKTSKSTVPWSLTRRIALSRTFAASCCRDGSLAVAQPLWSRKLPRFHRCLNGWGQLTLAHTRRAMPSPV